MKPDHHPLEHLFHATKWSLAGLKAAWVYEQAFRIEIVLSFLILPSAYYLAESNIEAVLLLGSWLLVLLVEILNSAIEAVVDRVGTDYHELSGRAKDLGSAAVLFAITIFIGTWLLLLVR